jgi:hypothetical protein
MGKVTVTVSGEAGCGKSTIARMIQDMLAEYDLDCTVEDHDPEGVIVQDARIALLQVLRDFEVEIRTVQVNATPVVGPFPDTATPLTDAEINDGWHKCKNGDFTRAGWTVKRWGALWSADHPEAGTIRMHPLTAGAARSAVDRLIARAARMAAVGRPFRPSVAPAGNPKDPLPADASSAEVAAQLLWAWPDCTIEAAPAALEREVPQPDDGIRAVAGPNEIVAVYAPELARTRPFAEVMPGGREGGWWFVIKSDPGRLPSKVTTIAAAVAAEVRHG